MSIAEITPESLPIELRVKVEHVMHEKRMTWDEVLVFLFSEVVSPLGLKAHHSCDTSFCPAGGFTPLST